MTVPFEMDALSHEEVFTRLQLTTKVPALVKVQVWLAGSSGPPAGPLNVVPVEGAMRSAFGGASNAAIRLLPAGVHHAQRQYLLRQEASSLPME